MNSQQLFDLSGRVAIVTGAAKGIGMGIAQNLASVGCSVAIADLDSIEAENVASEIRSKGDQAIAVSTDVSDETSVENLCSQTMSSFGHIDILVNNAAVYPMSPISEMTMDLWDHVLNVNLRGAFLMIRQLAPEIIKAGSKGRIINISSINTGKSYVGMPHYDSSKGGLEALTRSCALEYAEHGVTANVIAPGAVKTPGSMTVRGNLAKERGDLTTAEVDAEFASRIPLGDWATPDMIGQATTLLATPAASYITGQTIYVDGGLKLTI